MKKLYNTPELNVAKLLNLDTMTASGVVDTDTALSEKTENTYRMFSQLTD